MVIEITHKHLRNVLLGGLNNKLGSLFVDDLENPKEFYYFLHVNVCFITGTSTQKILMDIKNEVSLPALIFLDNNQQLDVIKTIFFKTSFKDQ